MKIIIVGAGPAGLSTALYLSSNNADVTIIDRFSDKGYERYHAVCGAGISRKTFGKLKYINLSNVINEVPYTVLHFPENTDVYMKIDGLVLDRVSFLKELKEQCIEKGCKFIRDEVLSVTQTNVGFNISTRKNNIISCDILVGCDGAHSVVRKDIFKSKPKGISAVTECILDRETENKFQIFLGEKYHGLYRWEFPAGKRTSIGSEKNLIDTTGCVEKGSRHIPHSGVPSITNGKAYLVGDAAAMPNPVSYGGLKAALLSGQECAKSILSEKPEKYTKWWKHSKLSSYRFKEFADIFSKWDDAEFIKASEPFKKGGNLYINGMKAALKHPGYIKMYIGCLMVFKHSW